MCDSCDSDSPVTQFPTPSKQFWYDRASKTIWWDLDLLRMSEAQAIAGQNLRMNGSGERVDDDGRHMCGVRKRNRWLAELNRRVAMDIDPDAELVFQKCERDPVP